MVSVVLKLNKPTGGNRSGNFFARSGEKSGMYVVCLCGNRELTNYIGVFSG